VEGFQNFEQNFFKYATSRTIFYWMVFGLLTGACISVILAEGTIKKKNVDCVLSLSWSDWVGCENLDCNANAFRSRTVLSEAAGDGLPCAQQDLLQTASCKTILPQCTVMNCQYSNWSPWSTCPDSCIRTPNDCSTIPNQIRSRNVIRTSMPGGDPCDWLSLVQSQECPAPPFCSLSKQCEPRAPPPNFSQCHPCPEIACTVTGNPIYTMCTTTNALGSPLDCEPGQLLYSRSCMYADCTTQCENNNYSYFSRCSVPCGDGSYMSTTGLDCPNVTVSDCNLMTCSTGGMVLSPTVFAPPGTPTPAFYQVCTAADSPTDFLSSTRCLARCASSESCLYAWQSATNGNVTLSSELPVSPTPILKFWSYSSLAQCVTPTWDMIGAACLYICEDTGNTQFSRFTNEFGASYDPVRGLVFPFENGSMSCPLTPELLTNTCPTPNNAGSLLGDSLNLDLIGSLGVIPGMMANYLFSDATKELGGHTFQCPISIDCLYQSWTDAGAWGQCSQETNANDQGTRSRNRTILSQPQFLGDPCQVEELIEYSQCNTSLTLNSSTDMWCPLYAKESNVVKSVSEYACHKICSDMRALYGPDACNSIQIYEETPVGGRDPEVFLLQFPGAVNATSVTSANMLNLPANFTVAVRAQLEGAWSSGMQSCLPGWFLNGSQQAAQALSVQQLGCGNNAPPNSLSIFSPQSNIKDVWVYGNKTDFNDLSLSNFTVYNFFTPTASPSMWDPKYLFASQTFQSEKTCAFFTDRTDILVGDCTSLSARAGVITSKLLDIPYSFAQNCSLTDWVTIHDCSQSCALINAQTRTIVNTYSSEGGLPCSRVATYRFSPCGASFSCPQTFSDVCILPALPTLSSYATSCSSVDFVPDVYLEEFSQPYIYTWSLILSITQQLNPTAGGGLNQYFSSSVRQNAQGGTLSVNVLQAINAQCGGGTSCLSLSDGLYSLSSVQAPFGWIKLNADQTCTTNSAFQACLQSRPAVAPSLVGRIVYDLGTNAWRCPSTCRPGGLSFSCAMGTYPLSECECTPPYFNPPIPPKQTEFLLYSSYTSVSTQNNDTKTLYSCNQVPFAFKFGCSTSSQCDPQPCKIGNDGSACNSFSGNGECDFNFGTCTCKFPPPTLSTQVCNSGCEIGRNGLVCSGEGLCEYQAEQDDFRCTCNAGRTGGRCENAGYGLVGLLESLLYEGTANILQVQEILGKKQPLPFSFTNYEPRCDNQNQTTPYCAGAQLFTPLESAQTPIFHGFYPPITRISYTTRSSGGTAGSKIMQQDYSNICVNSNDASFNSQWIGANYLSLPLQSFTGGVNVPIQCQDFLDQQGDEVFTITARFTSNSNIPLSLHNKLFYTRCPDNVSQYTVQDTNTFYKFLHINQYDSSGNILFNLIDTQTSLDNLCPNPPL